MPWWGWVLIVCGAILVFGVAWFAAIAWVGRRATRR
jgi:hypothetical protein